MCFKHFSTENYCLSLSAISYFDLNCFNIGFVDIVVSVRMKSSLFLLNECFVANLPYVVLFVHFEIFFNISYILPICKQINSVLEFIFFV